MTHTDSRAGDYAVATHGLSKRYGRESALEHVLGSRHPLRWVIGAVLSYLVVSSVASDAASAQLGAHWLADAPGRLMRSLIVGRYGLDALITARLESLGANVTLTTGEQAMVWWGVPDLAVWRTATLLWTGAGVLALWAAASRHRERRRA